MINLRSDFGKHRGSRSEQARQREWFIKARAQKEKQEHLDDRAEEEMTALGADLIAATQAQIERLEVKLDRYEVATTAALIENQQQLDQINIEIELLLNQAYVMEDGRRVFKTEDGTKVFDEQGEEVSADVLDPDVIGDEHPTWEAFKAKQDEKTALEVERHQLVEFQEKLDQARDEIADGDIAGQELDDLDAELDSLMPKSVRSEMPDMAAESRGALSHSFKSAVDDVNVGKPVVSPAPEQAPALSPVSP